MCLIGKTLPQDTIQWLPVEGKTLPQDGTHWLLVDMLTLPHHPTHPFLETAVYQALTQSYTQEN